MSAPFFLRKQLTESLALSVVQNRQHKTNYLSLYFCLPLSDEAASRAALLSHLITVASQDYPNMRDLRRATAALYSAEISASTAAIGDTLLLCINASFLKDRFAPAGSTVLSDVLSFLRSFLRRPLLIDGAFDPTLFKLEMKNAADDARAVLNDKSRLARRRHVEIMYEGDPFSASALGRAQDIEALDVQDVTESFFNLLATAPVEAIFVGEAEEDALRDALLSCFDGLQKTPRLCPETQVGEAPLETRHVTEYLPINQAHLCLGFRTPITRTHPDYYAFTVANTVFGAGTTSKLFMNVREKLSLCYRVASVFTAQKGFLQIYAGIDSAKAKDATDEILLQLSDTQKATVTEEELAHAKNTLSNAIRTYTSSPDTIISWAIPRLLAGVDVDPKREMNALLSVSAEEAAQAFCTLKPDTFYRLQKEDV